MSELEKPILKKSDKKTEHQCQSAACEQKNYEWIGKQFRKSDPKNPRNSKNNKEIAACEQKTKSEKTNFCSNTVF